MGMILPIILYALDIAKYWIGNRLFFKGKMKLPWLPIMGAAGILISFTFFSVSEAGRIVLAEMIAMVIVGVMIDESIVTKIVRIVWMECIIASFSDAMVVLLDRVLVKEEVQYILSSIIALVVITIGGYIFNRFLWKYSTSKIVFVIVYIVLLLICRGISFGVAVIQFMYKLSNRRLSRAISADYFRRKHLSQSAVNEAKAHYIGCHRRLSRAYFSSAMAGLK